MIAEYVISLMHLRERSRVHKVSRAASTFRFSLCLCLCLCICSILSACSRVKVDDASPQVTDVQVSANSSMTEASQKATVTVTFDKALYAEGDIGADFEVLLNGSAPDADEVAVDISVSGESLCFVFSPASPAKGAGAGTGAGTGFALYQSEFSLTSTRDDGALPSITGDGGSNAVMSESIVGTLPSGLTLEVVSRSAGSIADNRPAQTVVRVTSPALIRAITWFSVDGGETVLLKHNHFFADADAVACASDLAAIVNANANCNVVAIARDDSLTLTASSVVDGQLIEPCIIEGVGVLGGTLDGAESAF